MANPLMGILGGLTSGNGNIMLQAFGAMMRGESPQEFMRSLANTRPELRGMDLNDINGTAHKLCQERGIDETKLTAEIRQSVGKMM